MKPHEDASNLNWHRNQSIHKGVVSYGSVIWGDEMACWRFSWQLLSRICPSSQRLEPYIIAALFHCRDWVVTCGAKSCDANITDLSKLLLQLWTNHQKFDGHFPDWASNKLRFPTCFINKFKQKKIEWILWWFSSPERIRYAEKGKV